MFRKSSIIVRVHKMTVECVIWVFLHNAKWTCASWTRRSLICCYTLYQSAYLSKITDLLCNRRTTCINHHRITDHHTYAALIYIQEAPPDLLTRGESASVSSITLALPLLSRVPYAEQPWAFSVSSLRKSLCEWGGCGRSWCMLSPVFSIIR